MILQPTVELTKIRYYDGDLPTISREVFDNQVNSAVRIEKKFFRHRWVLKINEIGNGGGKVQWRVVLGVIVLSCLLVAVAFGWYFTCFRRVGRWEETVYTFVNYSVTTKMPVWKLAETHEKMLVKFCHNCTLDDICLKETEIDAPKCVKALDHKDPTGCGGFCSVNTQFCQLLDSQHQIYQCSNLTSSLKCPQNMFSCGNMCINETKRCDGFIHCSNKSDEFKCDCDLETHFQCGNMTSCLPKSRKCNGIVDCWDRSDEINCKIGCKNDTVPCLNGDCISKENFCDGKYHCMDHSDEPQGCQL